MGLRDTSLQDALLELIRNPLKPSLSSDQAEQLIQLGLASRWGNVVTITRAGRLAAFPDSQHWLRERPTGRCKDCECLVGQPTNVQPHAALVSEIVELRSDGDLERFRCRTCESKWERLVPNDVTAGKVSWRVTSPKRGGVRRDSCSSARSTSDQGKTPVTRWRFFQGLKDEWRWYHLDESNDVIAASDRAFAELRACMQNAERAGFAHTSYQVHARTTLNLPVERRKVDRSLSQR